MKIRELLTDKSKWTKVAYARDCKGEEVDPLSDDAVSFCLYGAIEKCYSESVTDQLYREVSHRLQRAINNKPDGTRILIWNDAEERTFEEVKALVEELDI